ncbi:putative glycosyl hydrolase [Xylaria bambusicola]|uniref:putative glycosyl hydrolase n=1 Tax=Xylaria bambusicola TaxID=326684 RepID=UPI0020088538|nr:putative glycosyl hydrolase [Xylaria bambusicola]KAI0515463.1 putative glycosyl hydrolase [Xylaria bambusicola]
MGLGKSKVARLLPEGFLDYTTSESGNPFVEGWYADPGSAAYDGLFWVYAVRTGTAKAQTCVDAFSTSDLIHWDKHPNVLTTANWVKKGIRSPTPISQNGKYYIYFSTIDTQGDDTDIGGGIGVAVADTPEGPYVDAIGKPLISENHNGARPTDPDVLIDDSDGQAYIYYGGQEHANVAILNKDMISVKSSKDNTKFKEITPKGYIGGSRILKRNGVYYFMWSEHHPDNPDYSISYAMGDSPLGPFNPVAKILEPDSAVTKRVGRSSMIHVPNTDIWYVLYHRQPLSETDKDHCIIAYDRIYFNEDNTIQPVRMLVKDNFADGRMLDWTTYGGQWSVEEQRLTVQNAGSGMAMLDTNFSDLIFDATIATVSGNGHPGLLFRVTELSAETHKYKGYKAAISPTGVITLGKADLGVFTDLAQTKMDMVTGEEYHVRVMAIGSEIKVYVNDMDKARITFSDNSFTTGANGVRIFNSAAKFGFVSVAGPS